MGNLVQIDTDFVDLVDQPALVIAVAHRGIGQKTAHQGGERTPGGFRLGDKGAMFLVTDPQIDQPATCGAGDAGVPDTFSVMPCLCLRGQGAKPLQGPMGLQERGRM